jgi:streptogramin lyase
VLFRDLHVLGSPALRMAASILLSSTLLSGCASNAVSGIPPASQSPAAIHTGSDSQRARAGKKHTVPVVFKIKWKSKHPIRRPHYLPATARSIAISLNGGVAQYANAPSSIIYLEAPPGVDTFAIAAYDEENGLGNIIAAANVTQNILVGGNNAISATLNAVIASIFVALGNPRPNAGLPAQATINMTALDADGNVIVGNNSDYATPVRLTISDSSNSGTLSLSPSVLQGPWATATLQYNGGTLSSGLSGQPLASVVASVTGLPSASANFTPTPTIYQFSIPTGTNKPQWISAGPDGNMWFTESPGNKVARITTAGVVTEFTIPTANSNPQDIISATDGRLWFTEFTGSKIGAVTTSGTFTENGTLFGTDGPQSLVDRLDGNVWFVGYTGDHIGYQGVTSGVAGETTIPTAGAQPYGIATAPDNNLYATESGVDKIARISNLFGTITEVALTAGTRPLQIVRGPDGNLWFAENGRNNIGRLSPNSFSVTGEFPSLTPNSEPTGITVGADGALWFTETGLDKIGRITTAGTQSEFTSATTGLGLQGIAPAADGSLWFTEPGSGPNPGRIGRLVY